MKYCLFVCFVVFIFVSSVENAKILAIIPLSMYSHYVMFEKLFIGLARKGHEVDVVSHFPQKVPVPGLNDLSIKGSMPMLQNNLSLHHIDNFTQNLYRTVIFQGKECGVDTCEAAFKTKVLHDLKHTKKKYDLLITEIFGSDCMLGFAHLFKIPVISMTSSVNMPWGADRIGNPDNPSYIPAYFMHCKTKMTLWERILNTYVLLQSKFWYYFVSTRPSNALAKEFFGNDLPDLEELFLNTSLIMVNSHFSTNQARPTVPNFIEVGGLHIATPKALPADLEEIMQKGKTGVIYFTMGSMIRAETFSFNKLQGFLDAFAEFPDYIVMWKAPKEKFPKGLKIPSNVYFQNWLPQLDMLCHPKTKLFISHGGLMGSQEAMYCGVPRIGIPCFADQENNIHKAEEMGLVVKVPYKKISKATIYAALTELLTNQSYAENSKRISELFRDRPQTPLETAIFWTEYVLRHHGAPHLRSIGADLNWFQYHLIDVAFVVVSAFSAVLFVVIKLVKCVFCKSKAKKQKQS